VRNAALNTRRHAFLARVMRRMVSGLALARRYMAVDSVSGDWIWLYSSPSTFKSAAWGSNSTHNDMRQERNLGRQGCLQCHVVAQWLLEVVEQHIFEPADVIRQPTIHCTYEGKLRPPMVNWLS
jgi:hypothetical protein